MTDPAALDVHSRTITWRDPRTLFEQARALGGLEYLRAVQTGALPVPPIWELIGIRPAEVEAGHVVFTGEPQQFHLNPLGVVHGGFAATLLDSATACAVWTTQPAGVSATTLEIKVNYMRALTDATGPLRAEGRLLHGGKRTALAEGRLMDDAGALYAFATSTLLIARPQVGTQQV
jgi:uncharacterized protein (TIGR00369 family)